MNHPLAMQPRYPSSPPLAFLKASDVDQSWSTVASVLLQDIRERQSTTNPKLVRGHIQSDEDLSFELFAQEANRLHDAVPDAILAHGLQSASEFQSTLPGERELEVEGSLTFMKGDSLEPTEGQLRPLSPRSFMDTECAICKEIVIGRPIRVPCGHVYDVECLEELFAATTTDESLFPPRCCGQSIPLENIRYLFDADLITAFESKRPITNEASSLMCPSCQSRTCAHCLKAAHSTMDCASEADEAALALAKTRGWARCPGCQHIVERTEGCPHMRCRCNQEFCYSCGAAWRTCSC